MPSATSSTACEKSCGLAASAPTGCGSSSRRSPDSVKVPWQSRYAIGSRGEADAYLAHATLGPRLRECTELVNRVESSGITEILGSPDDIKFRSSMTLFARATADNAVFLAALAKYFSGEADPATLARL